MTSTPTNRRKVRGNPFLQEKVHDPYHDRHKPKGNTQCPDCGAQFRDGRWTVATPKSAPEATQRCPACHRIHDGCPAGELVLRGIDDDRRDEIMKRVKNIATEERAEHPLHRIMSVDRNGDDTVIRTTDIHLPHRLAHAIRNAWGGELDTHYDLAGYFARITWQPDAD